jgi:hypothetical protein
VQGAVLGDLFDNNERGFPMAMFAFSAFAPTALGPICFGYVAMLKGFKLVFWIQFALAAVLTVIIWFVQAETRESVLLSRRARKMRLDTGDERYVAKADEERASFSVMMKITLTRPFKLLAHEAPIQAWTVYVAFACEQLDAFFLHDGGAHTLYFTSGGVLYLLLLSIPIVYRDVYGFNLGQVGLTYISQIIGSSLAMPISLYCDKLYRRHVATVGPEARMYAGMIGGLLVTIGAWIWAWTSWQSIHWLVPLIGVTILYAGLLQVYLTCFNYITDGYTFYAASALAASESLRQVLIAQSLAQAETFVHSFSDYSESGKKHAGCSCPSVWPADLLESRHSWCWKSDSWVSKLVGSRSVHHLQIRQAATRS